MSKPNKFTKSIIERLEIEQNQTKLKQKEDKIVRASEQEKKQVKTKKVERKEKPQENKTTNTNINITIDSLINKKEQRKAKNKTFYLDEEVIKTLQKEAKRLEMTDSKLANEIFKSVLNIK